MKKFKYIFLILSIFIVIGVTIGINTSINAANLPKKTVAAKLMNSNTLDKVGIKLESPSISEAKITKEIAIKSAQNAFPEWYNDATEISSNYYLISNKNFKSFSTIALNTDSNLKNKGYMDKLPVYIVTFSGMSYNSAVPNGYTGDTPVHNEYNVVVDANSGEALMGFSYK